MVEVFRKGLRELDRVRVESGGSGLEQPGEEAHGEGDWNRPRRSFDSDVELHEVMGKSVEVLGEVGAMGGVGGRELGQDIKRSPVGSCSFAGMGLEDSKGDRWRSSTRGGPVKEEIGR